MSISNRVNPLLPEEILTEILSLLPAKSLGRCKCVSKPWRSLISDPQFIQTHLSKRTDLHQKLLLISDEPNPDCGSLYAVEFDNNNGDLSGSATKLNLDYPDDWSEVLGSCNGLILVADEERTTFLLNPTTLEAKKLQVSPFVLDPRACYIMYGFGFDASTDDYKVVTIFYYDTDNEHEPDCTDMFINVYMLKRNVWRRVKNSPYDHARAGPMSGVFVNGSLHWLASNVDDYYSSVIAAFDLATEEFFEVKPPSEVVNDELVFHELAVIGGCLCVINDSRNNMHIDVWEMEEYGVDVWVMEEYGVEESWAKFSIVKHDLSSFRPLRLLGDWKVLLDNGGEKLGVYNVEDETLRDMAVLGIPSEFRAGLTFVDSLVSPNSNNRNNEMEGQNEASGEI